MNKTKMGKTALMLAAVNNQNATANLLIGSGSDLKITNNKGETVLMRASKIGNTEIVKLLIDMGIDVNIRDKKGEASGHYAKSGNHIEIVRLLKKAGAIEFYRSRSKWMTGLSVGVAQGSYTEALTNKSYNSSTPSPQFRVGRRTINDNYMISMEMNSWMTKGTIDYNEENFSFINVVCAVTKYMNGDEYFKSAYFIPKYINVNYYF